MFSSKLKHASAVAALTMFAVAMLAVPAPATAPTHKNVHFTATVTGAAIGRNQAAFKIHDSVSGNGAGVQTLLSVSATRGTDITTTYYGNASVVTRDTFTLSAPDSRGIITVTGRGHDIRGTGRFRHLRGSYTYTGTYDPKTTRTLVRLTGTESY